MSAHNTPCEQPAASLPNNTRVADDQFFLRAPRTLAEAGIHEADVEALLLKSLLALGAATGGQLAARLKLPRTIVIDALHRLRSELFVTLKDSLETGDFVYQLTDGGIERARRFATHSAYSDAAPVSLEQYTESVRRQSATRAPFELDSLSEALQGLQVSGKTLSRLAQAVKAGRGMFLYGSAGNGKTIISERLNAAYPQPLWIPRAINAGGEIIRLFDASLHKEIRLTDSDGELTFDREEVDQRWVLIRRPAVIVGGEFSIEGLDLSPSGTLGVLEAPVQMKANGGTLVIDDFGRQRSSAEELLNRWIVTLEKRIDHLTLQSGCRIQVPFDENLILATNLDPKELVDEAYLRRVPFKIELRDPDEEVFRRLFREESAKSRVVHDEEVVTYLIETYYKPNSMAFRFCHPRDLVFQVANLCDLCRLPRQLTRDAIDDAVSNYFCDVCHVAV